jgi:DNA polymerase-1
MITTPLDELRVIAADLETDGLQRTVTKIHCCGLYNSDTQEVIVGHDTVLCKLQDMLDDGWVLAFHNAAYDVAVLRGFGLRINEGQYICTQVLWHKVNPTLGSYSLDNLGKRFDVQKGDYMQDLVDAKLFNPAGNKDADKSAIWHVPYNEAMRIYCLQDTRICWLLWQAGEMHLLADERLQSSFLTVHLPFVEVMMSMQRGMFVDRQALITLMYGLLAAQEVKLNAFYSKYPSVAKIKWDKELRDYRIEGDKRHCPNIKSPNDVNSLLMANGWEPTERDYKTNRPKTSQATLRYSIATLPDGKLKNLIVELADLKSCEGILTQLTTLLKVVDIKTGALYGNWFQCGAVSHRLTSSAPNCQNLSVRNKVWGKRVRSCFAAPPGYTLLIGDLAQIELCILAAYLEIVNDDSDMADGARAGLDHHSTNTANWFDIDESDPEWKVKRAIAKNGIFASSYGAKALRLALTLGVSLSEAIEILNVVDNRTTINKLKQKVWATARTPRNVKAVVHHGKARNDGFLYDSMGTRGFYPELNSSERFERSSAERKSFNALMQTGCFSIFAHLLNLSLPIVQQAGGWVAATVHDEAHFFVPDAEADRVLATVNEVFCSYTIPTPKGGVPVRASFSACKSWADKV